MEQCIASLYRLTDWRHCSPFFSCWKCKYIKGKSILNLARSPYPLCSLRAIDYSLPTWFSTITRYYFSISIFTFCCKIRSAIVTWNREENMLFWRKLCNLQKHILECTEMHFLTDLDVNKCRKSSHHTQPTRLISAWSKCCDTVKSLELTQTSEMVSSEEVKHSWFVSTMFNWSLYSLKSFEEIRATFLDSTRVIKMFVIFINIWGVGWVVVFNNTCSIPSLYKAVIMNWQERRWEMPPFNFFLTWKKFPL